VDRRHLRGIAAGGGRRSHAAAGERYHANLLEVSDAEPKDPDANAALGVPSPPAPAEIRDALASLCWRVREARADPATDPPSRPAGGEGLGAEHRLPEDVLDALADYVRRLLVANQETNLTASGTIAGVAEVAVVDAAVLNDVFPRGSAFRFVDVGTGGGAPGIPFALLRPEASGVLVEPRRRRWAFLVDVVAALGLGDRLRVVKGRVSPADGAPALKIPPSDLAMARATFPPDVWLRVGPRLAPRVAAFLTAPAPQMPGLRLLREVDYGLPVSGARRRLSLHERRPAAPGRRGKATVR
jgi:16S rRNA (guanine527-N7)-methyltransferase